MDQTPSTVTIVTTTPPPKWRSNVIHVLQILGILAAYLAGVDFVKAKDFLPANVAAWLIVTGPAVAAIAKPTVEFLGDLFDDGKINKSFVALLLIGLFCTFTLVSCTGLVAGYTGTPPATVPVQRVDKTQPAFNLALQDAMRAEAAVASGNPGKWWGLYDGGAVGAAVGQVVESGK